jgi:hypothetical protein
MVVALSHPSARIQLVSIAFPAWSKKEAPMRKFILPLAALILLAGCETREHLGVGVAPGGPEYYDGYYDGFYGPFNDGYWGDDGFFWYSGGDRAWHRDENHHFQRMAGNGFNHVHGSGAHREH